MYHRQVRDVNNITLMRTNEESGILQNLSGFHIGTQRLPFQVEQQYLPCTPCFIKTKNTNVRYLYNPDVARQLLNHKALIIRLIFG